MKTTAMQPTPEPPTPLAVSMARAVHALGYADLPAEAAAKAKLCLLDLFSCALASHELPWCRQAVALARASSRTAGVAPIIGTRDAVAPGDAALANGVLGHGLVRDDVHVGSASHLGAVIVPALLALVAEGSASGKDFLTALTAGYEIGGRIGRAIPDDDVARIFRPTGITGPIAAAAAGAKLLGLGERETAVAVALAANTASGNNEWAATGGSEMFFHAGLAARSAVTCVQLAAAGAHASASALDGQSGLLAAFGKLRPGDVPPPFADRPEILAVFFKPVPGCNFAQTAAQAAQAIARAHGPQRDVARITVRVTRAAASYPGCDCAGPFEHVLQAKTSIHYHVAAALATGNFAERNYAPQQNADVLRLAALSRLEIDAELTRTYPHAQGAEVIVELADGTELRHRAADVVPATPAEVRARFLAAAEEKLGPSRAAELERFIDDLDTADEARLLNRLVRAAPAT